MDIPVVTIVGRPNVGKSSILNCLARKRISIVDPTSGVTRDRVSTLIRHEDTAFELIDTGGLGVEDSDDLTAEVETQIEIALTHADLILFVVNVREGVVPLDVLVAERLRKLGRPSILVVNKVDDYKHEIGRVAFYSLGFDEPSLISTHTNEGRMDLLDRIVETLPASTHVVPPEDAVIKLAIVGKRNAGKSTLINTLVQENRLIVSEKEGTTRDSVDVRFEHKNKSFILIDTAGVRKKRHIKHSVDFYSDVRAERSIRRCDVALLMLDAVKESSALDKRLTDYILEHDKACIVVVNKWDLMTDVETEDFVEYVQDRLRALHFAPISFVSAKDNFNLVETIELAEELVRQSSQHVSTADVNKALSRAREIRSPSRRKSKSPKIFYGTQSGINPATFILFASYPSLISESYRRFLANQFRKELPFPEVPIRFYFRSRK